MWQGERSILFQLRTFRRSSLNLGVFYKLASEHEHMKCQRCDPFLKKNAPDVRGVVSKE